MQTQSQWKVERLSEECILRVTMDISVDDIAALLVNDKSKIDLAKEMIRVRQPLFDALSVREKEILRLVIQPLSNKQVAGALNIALDTVKTHRKNLMRKLSCRSLKELMEYRVFYDG
ncbi:LuxR C-terminal-related transcriptional regulator [Niabella drilacis]|uniref:Regulatory protein, luxR family n=1 Tax=Niabella drilacis (strain DSM 25811 / CCM 8410 / CCUG 62505 / LMG 26954 / E90) TaxID=1285928 RepID=A0A1G7BVQ4_NIADE|nr:helix-turn-helix transcriptional regulator [Niabella drilacis]SDE31129.1 regulatory protein, luxR family [Niabella drilacis]